MFNIINTGLSFLVSKNLGSIRKSKSQKSESKSKIKMLEQEQKQSKWN